MEALRRDFSYFVCHRSDYWRCRGVVGKIHTPTCLGKPTIHFRIRFHSLFFFSSIIHFPFLYQVTPTINKDHQEKKLKTSKNPTSLSKDLTFSFSLYGKFSKVLSGLSISPVLPSHSLLGFPSYFTYKKQLSLLS